MRFSDGACGRAPRRHRYRASRCRSGLDLGDPPVEGTAALGCATALNGGGDESEPALAEAALRASPALHEDATARAVRARYPPADRSARPLAMVLGCLRLPEVRHQRLEQPAQLLVGVAGAAGDDQRFDGLPDIRGNVIVRSTQDLRTPGRSHFFVPEKGL